MTKKPAILTLAISDEMRAVLAVALDEPLAADVAERLHLPLRPDGRVDHDALEALRDQATGRGHVSGSGTAL